MRGNVVLQSNAEFFIGAKTKRKAISLLKKGMVNVLGSDCHNLSDRPENIGEAFDLLKNVKGGRFVAQIEEAERILMESVKK